MNLNAIRISGGYNYVPRKIFLVMKITAFLLLISVLTVSASTFAQKITLNEKKANLDDVLNRIRQQSGYDIIYREDVLEKSTPVTIKITDATLEEALKASLRDQQLSYEIEEKTVLIKIKANTFLDNLKPAFVNFDVHGRVVDENGKALPGATVKLKDQSQATTSDKDGEFLFKKIDDNAVIVISSIGYLTKEIHAKAELGTIQMEISNSKLDEIQVIAYGTTSRRLSTGNIASVKSDVISQQPVTNPLLALQGRIPGLYIEQSSGISMANVDVTVQGKNSIANGNQPFYVIDGVPYTPQDIASPVLSGVFPGLGGSTLSFINPSDIESIEVLKDADATAIYGSRAANGAILITTKKGRAGKTKVDLNLQNGWGRITRKQSLLNNQQYLDLRKEAVKNGGTPIDPSDYDINGTWDPNKNTDWQDALIGGTAHFQNTQVSVSGGSKSVQFLAGGGYQRETTVYPGDFSNVKGNVHFNINQASENNKFHFALSGNFLQGINKLPNADLANAAITLAPIAPDLYKPDGSVNWAPLVSSPTTSTFTDNPVSQLLRKYQEKTNNLIGSMNLSYELMPGLLLKSDLGYNRLESDEVATNPVLAVVPERRNSNSRSSNYSNKYIDSWIIEPQLSFNKELPFGHIDALIGSSFQQSNNYLQAFRGRGFTNDSQLQNIKAASTVTSTSTLQSTYRYNALFGRLNYRYQDKYILNFTARRDGSSRFGSEDLFNNFYSAGAAWLFGDEKSFKDLFPFINYGKLRVTYGTTGNDQIPDYQFLNLYDNYSVDIPYQQAVGLLPNGLPNPYLQWEETRKINFGIDLGLFNNRILLNVNYFLNRSSNQLLVQSLPVVTGFNNLQINLPATVQNTGWEFMLDAGVLKSGNFIWKASANFTIPKNKLISFPNLENSVYAKTLIIGQPFNITKTYAYAGVNAQTGLYQFRTSTGALTSAPSSATDQTTLIDLNPKFYGGFSNSFIYKSLSLDFLFQLVKQTAKNNRFGNYPGTTVDANQPSTVLNRWHSPGDAEALTQKVSTNFGEIDGPFTAAGNSDAAYSDASFLRLRNASLSYSLPSLWMQRVQIAAAKIYVQGQNLLTFTNFQGGDPETKGTGTLPPLKVYTIGLQLTF